jgi:hypothetical protein
MDSMKTFTNNPQSVAKRNFFYDLPELNTVLGWIN